MRGLIQFILLLFFGILLSAFTVWACGIPIGPTRFFIGLLITALTTGIGAIWVGDNNDQ